MRSHAISILCTCLAAYAMAEDAVKLPSIAIMDLQGQCTRNWGNPSEQVTQAVGSAFAKTRRFDLLERSQLNKVMGEARRQNQASSGFDDSQAADLGKLVGAKMVVVGSYLASDEYHPAHDEADNKGRRVHYDATFVASLNGNFRLINIETGKVLESFEVKGSSLHSPSLDKAKSETIMDFSRKVDREVANRYPVTGYVIKIISEKEFLLDLGKTANVASDDEFVVVERAPDIVHPVTGKVIKGEKKIVTTLKAKDVQEDTCIVKVTGNHVALKLGAAVESLPKKRGWGEAFSDLMKN